MDYDVCFRTLQSIEEETKCRSFFMDQAVNLDFSRYLDRNGDVMMECDNEDFLPTVGEHAFARLGFAAGCSLHARTMQYTGSTSLLPAT